MNSDFSVQFKFPDTRILDLSSYPPLKEGDTIDVSFDFVLGKTKVYVTGPAWVMMTYQSGNETCGFVTNELDQEIEFYQR